LLLNSVALPLHPHGWRIANPPYALSSSQARSTIARSASSSIKLKSDASPASAGLLRKAKPLPAASSAHCPLVAFGAASSSIAKQLQRKSIGG
jgi:hypothetical protein